MMMMMMMMTTCASGVAVVVATVVLLQSSLGRLTVIGAQPIVGRGQGAFNDQHPATAATASQ
jgi:hypothetical protein